MRLPRLRSAARLKPQGLCPPSMVAAKARNPLVMGIGSGRASPLTFRPIPSRLDEVALQQAVQELVKVEPRFAVVVERHGLPPLRLVDNSLASLLRIVTEQLISLQAAAAIWGRLEQALDPVSPATVRGLGIDGLKAAGLSTAKARCFLTLADCHDDGRLDFESLALNGDHEAMQQLTKLPGIGPWTAEIYVITALGRADIFPAGDRALQLAAHHFLALNAEPSAAVLIGLAEAWRPWRSVAARLLWSHYRGVKGLSQKVT